MNDIKNFETWTKVTKGYYRYVIAAKACYEIIIIYDDGIVRRGNLYITGDWKETNGLSYFIRELLQDDKDLEICLETAYLDYTKNE